MTLEERIAMVDAKIENDEKKRIAKDERYKREYEECLTKIKELTPRISDLLKFAWYAIDNGISLSTSGWGGNEGYDTGVLISNSWSHVVGIKNRDYLGITKGGAYGYIDFYTNGNETYGYDTEKGIKVSALLDDMKRFLNKFGELEESLYKYVEKKCEIQKIDSLTESLDKDEPLYL